VKLMNVAVVVSWDLVKTNALNPNQSNMSMAFVSPESAQNFRALIDNNSIYVK